MSLLRLKEARTSPTAESASQEGAVIKIRVGCPAHNCRGRCLLIIFIPQVVASSLDIFIFLVALAAEAVGRWQFYAQRPISPL